MLYEKHSLQNSCELLDHNRGLYSHYKKKRKLLNVFCGVNINDFQNNSISVALSFNQYLYNSFVKDMTLSSVLGLKI